MPRFFVRRGISLPAVHCCWFRKFWPPSVPENPAAWRPPTPRPRYSQAHSALADSKAPFTPTLIPPSPTPRPRYSHAHSALTTRLRTGRGGRRAKDRGLGGRGKGENDQSGRLVSCGEGERGCRRAHPWRRRLNGWGRGRREKTDWLRAPIAPTGGKSTPETLRSGRDWASAMADAA